MIFSETRVGRRAGKFILPATAKVIRNRNRFRCREI